MEQPTAILASDLHLMSKTPECRTDDFIATQKEKWNFIKDTIDKYQVPFLIGGDVFDTPNPQHWLLSWWLSLGINITTVAGQHDLPAHNINNIDKSGLKVLEAAGRANILGGDKEYEFNDCIVHGFNWNETPKPIKNKKEGKTYIALIHYMVYEKEPPFPGAENVGGNAKKLMRMLRGYDLILSGDNHVPFTVKTDNQLLVNPGSIMRTTSKQIDHLPALYMYFSGSNEVVPVYLPIKKENVSREHLMASEREEAKINAFVERLSDDFEISLSFRKNIEEYTAKNNIRPNVKNIIQESLNI